MKKMKGLGKIVASILIAGSAAGCATTGTPGITINHYNSQHADWDVEVTEKLTTEEHPRCVYRQIVLDAQPKLHLGLRAYHVKAIDSDCDDRVDQWFFRDPTNHPSYMLELDVMHAFYKARFEAGVLFPD